MDALTTIKGMINSGYISVPNYQRAYSWDTDSKSNPKQVNQFLIDLENHINSSTTSKYYFGHFLFEQKSNSDTYGVIDGQQRLTTIIIFLAVIFKILKERRNLTPNEIKLYNKLVCESDGICLFKTVDYDDQFFRDYVIAQNTANPTIKTESQKRIKDAFDFFVKTLSQKDDEALLKLLDIVQNASCSTHVITNEADAIQMFIFQNDRGKKPTKLEKVKAQFMFHIHLYGGNEKQKEQLLNELKERFENIYLSIESINQIRRIEEDSILSYTAKVYFNQLADIDVEKLIADKLSNKEDCITFIKEFTHRLAESFDCIKDFIMTDKIYINSLVELGNYSITLPFIIKAYLYPYNLSEKDLEQLCLALESIIIRHQVIGTRADLTKRLEDVYKNFNGTIDDIVGRIKWMKEQEGWWVYWNNDEFKRALQGYFSNSTMAKYLLWKYENHLISKEGKAGYSPIKYESIKNPQLEHIAPQNPSEDPKSIGYCEYDEEFRNQYLNCLGNYLLLSGSHNASISNGPFEIKRKTYNQLRQQWEVQQMTESDKSWNKEKILARKNKIVSFILNTF